MRMLSPHSVKTFHAHKSTPGVEDPEDQGATRYSRARARAFCGRYGLAALASPPSLPLFLALSLCVPRLMPSRKVLRDLPIAFLSPQPRTVHASFTYSTFILIRLLFSWSCSLAFVFDLVLLRTPREPIDFRFWVTTCNFW